MGDFPNAPNTIRLPNGTIVRGPDTYNAKGNDLPNAPKLTANLSATYVIPSSIGDISFTGNVYYNDGRFAEVDNRLRDGSYTLVDASVGWKSTEGTRQAARRVGRDGVSKGKCWGGALHK